MVWVAIKIGCRQGGPGRTALRGRVSGLIVTDSAAAGQPTVYFHRNPFGPQLVGCFSPLLAPHVQFRYARRENQSAPDHLEKQATDRRRKLCYLRDRALGPLA
jgi:hypothetical protein